MPAAVQDPACEGERTSERNQKLCKYVCKYSKNPNHVPIKNLKKTLYIRYYIGSTRKNPNHVPIKNLKKTLYIRYYIGSTRKNDRTMQPPTNEGDVRIY